MPFINSPYASLEECVRAIYPNITNSDFIIKDDGNGQYIFWWGYRNHAQPTNEELNAEVLDIAKKNKELEIRYIVSQKLEGLASPYMEQERLTWPIQKEEAEAYLANPLAITPMIDQIASNRGVTKAVLVSLIMQNTALFTQYCGVYLGQQQFFLTQIYNAETIEDVEAITWS